MRGDIHDDTWFFVPDRGQHLRPDHLAGFAQLDGQLAAAFSVGRGGMAAKVETVRLAAICGLYTYVTSGFHTEPLSELLDENKPIRGTLVYPQMAIKGKKRWIGMASGAYGIVVVNEGARQALIEKRSSLLPVGITAVEGEFQPGQEISIQDERGMELGRGMTFFSSKEVEKIKGLKSRHIAEHLGSEHPARDREEVIHRDNLVIFEEASA